MPEIFVVSAIFLQIYSLLIFFIGKTLLIESVVSLFESDNKAQTLMNACRHLKEEEKERKKNGRSTIISNAFSLIVWIFWTAKSICKNTQTMEKRLRLRRRYAHTKQKQSPHFEDPVLLFSSFFVPLDLMASFFLMKFCFHLSLLWADCFCFVLLFIQFVFILHWAFSDAIGIAVISFITMYVRNDVDIAQDCSLSRVYNVHMCGAASAVGIEVNRCNAHSDICIQFRTSTP